MKRWHPDITLGRRGGEHGLLIPVPRTGEGIWHLDLYYSPLSSGILDLVSEFSNLVWNQLELKKKLGGGAFLRYDYQVKIVST